MAEKAMPKYPSLNIRLSRELRARVEACAKLEGVSVPEFSRLALMVACQATERRSLQRERARRKAEGLADD